MFSKLVAIEPLGLVPEADAALAGCAKSVVLYPDIPQSDDEIIRRIGDADGVLLSYTSSIRRPVLEACPTLRYVGMCCSLYAPESANVDIPCAKERGIAVTGIRDYGDQGVVEYVVSELIRLLYGFSGGPIWGAQPEELAGLRVGIVGLGTSGQMVARGLQAFGCQSAYYSRTRKPDCEADGMAYLPLLELLSVSDVVCTCLNKNTVLLDQAAFEALGNHKILLNTGLSPSYDLPEVRRWLAGGDNWLLTDTAMALGDSALALLPNVRCAGQSAGRTRQASIRMSKKVLANISTYLVNH